MSYMRTIHARTGLVFLLAVIVSAPHVRASPRDFGNFSADDVVLVVAPHPDDETLCCAGVIQRARAAGARVAIVWITSGDGFELDAHVVEHRLFTGKEDLRELARLRMLEAARAAQLLGVAPAERFFLGYPDGGIAHIMEDHTDLPYRSPHTGASAVPYPRALRPGAAYTAANLTRDFISVFGRLQPTWVLAPTPLDEHEDHSATGKLVMRTMMPIGQFERMRFWIVHGGIAWPWPRGLYLEEALVPPARLRALPWRDFDLLPAERTQKEAAVRVYETQMRVMSSFMLSFVKRNEIYSLTGLWPPTVSAPPAQKTP